LKNITLILPAYNEATRLGPVIQAVKESLELGYVDDAIFVDNASSDRTASVIRSAGLRALDAPERGKGQAIAAGIAVATTEYIMTLDTDLTGIEAAHIRKLADGALENPSAMILGLFDRGKLLNLLHYSANKLSPSKVPLWTGQRVFSRELHQALDPISTKGFAIESALNALAAERGVPVISFVLEGVFHHPKRLKLGSRVGGLKANVEMVREIRAATAQKAEAA
jgi:glycosyltransferase involved in cell wall biosynthesis